MSKRLALVAGLWIAAAGALVRGDDRVRIFGEAPFAGKMLSMSPTEVVMEKGPIRKNFAANTIESISFEDEPRQLVGMRELVKQGDYARALELIKEVDMSEVTRAEIKQDVDFYKAFAYAKYMRYADQARRDGNSAVAQLFASTAAIELNEHFASLANLAGLVAASTNANLTDAINGEQHEADVMYPDYARQADAAGNPQAAGLFREIAGDEKTHQKAFQTALTTS